jgi:CcmD family protein
MDKLKRIGFVIACCMLNAAAMAQNNSPEDPNDFMRSNGKIYVVVAVAAVIITGLFLYLLNLERKIKKLEKEYK